MAKKEIEYFFNPEGELMSYVGYRGILGPPLTAKEAAFTGELAYLTYERGRSSALLIFRDNVFIGVAGASPRPRRFPFFMSDADKIIPRLVQGKITGTFVPHKRGTNYGWTLEDE